MTNVGGTAANLTAGHVTNATLTTALTVDTGALTIHAAGAGTSVLTIGAGAVSVSGSNTGDQTNVSGSAATVTGAAQTAITSVGTLTGLTVSGAIAANGGITFDAATDTIGAFTAGGTIAMGAQALTGTTGIINYTNFDVDASGNTDVGGTITAGSGNIQVTDAAGKVQHDSIVDCADTQILKWATAGGWGCAADAVGGGAATPWAQNIDAANFILSNIGNARHGFYRFHGRIDIQPDY